MHQQQIAFENIVGKGEIACNEQFLLFPGCFLLNQITVMPFVHIFDIMLLFSAKFEKPKNGVSGKGLRWKFCWVLLSVDGQWEKTRTSVGYNVIIGCLPYNF